MGAQNREPFQNPIIEWIDSRLPVFTMMQKEYGSFPTPKNFNYFWSFGGMAMMVLMVMILSGVFLAMNFTPHADMAFNSVERITRDVNYGWLLRSIHMNGASMFFIVVYFHIFRGLYYGSYKQPRELLWILGVFIFLLMMATAFMGYVLPWSQMSGWGATVITNLFSAFPLIGDGIVTWLWGGFSVDNPTLNRFFALHFLLPFVIVGVVFLHVWALHITGSNNPAGVEPKTEDDTIPFHPYYTTKDMLAIVFFVIVYAAITFFAPDAFVHSDHYQEFNPLVTPPQIVPEWYFLPFYAILRAFTYDISIFGVMLLPAKLQGVLAMFGSIVLLFFLPWIDRSKVRSATYRPLFRKALYGLVISLFVLGYVGAQHAEEPFITIGQLATAYYFGFFLVLLPLINKYEKPLSVPRTISSAVNKKQKSKPKAKDPVAKKKPAAKKAPTKKAMAKKTVKKKAASKKKAVKKSAKKTGKKLAFLLAAIMLSSTPVIAAEGVTPPTQAWPHHGMTGTFDRASLQRGLQVYRQVCSACHSMNLLSYRNLTALGYTDQEVRAIASEATVVDGPNDEGEMFERPGIPADRFASPYPNENAARYANGGAYPPDFSLIVRARHYGEDYVYGLLTGYKEAPTGTELLDGMYYNEYFPGHQIGMAPPLSDGMVDYEDGTEATVEQMARDVTQFLAWASDPHMEVRKKMGVKVLIFLFIFAGIMYFTKKKVWSDLDH